MYNMHMLYMYMYMLYSVCMSARVAQEWLKEWFIYGTTYIIAAWSLV